MREQAPHGPLRIHQVLRLHVQGWRLRGLPWAIGAPAEACAHLVAVQQQGVAWRRTGRIALTAREGQRRTRTRTVQCAGPMCSIRASRASCCSSSRVGAVMWIGRVTPAEKAAPTAWASRWPGRSARTRNTISRMQGYLSRFGSILGPVEPFCWCGRIRGPAPEGTCCGSASPATPQQDSDRALAQGGIRNFPTPRIAAGHGAPSPPRRRLPLAGALPELEAQLQRHSALVDLGRLSPTSPEPRQGVRLPARP